MSIKSSIEKMDFKIRKIKEKKKNIHITIDDDLNTWLDRKKLNKSGLVNALLKKYKEHVTQQKKAG